MDDDTLKRCLAKCREIREAAIALKRSMGLPDGAELPALHSEGTPAHRRNAN